MTESLVLINACFFISDSGFVNASLNLFMVWTEFWLVELFIVNEIFRFQTTYDLF